MKLAWRPYKAFIHPNISIVILILELCCVSVAGCSCVDEKWVDSCKVSMGDVYRGRLYNTSITGKPCVEGTVCEYNFDNILIQCMVASDPAPFYEECKIPLCADLPLCDDELENLEAASILSRGGIAVVSTPSQLMVAMRNREVTEIVLERDVTISEDDLNGIPIFFQPERKLVINKPGNARIICIIREDNTVPGFFVYSGAYVTFFRITFVGNPFVNSFVHWERLGHFHLIDSESYIQSCSIVSAYIQTLSAFQLDQLRTTVTGNEEESTLAIFISESGVLPGGGGHAGMIMYDTEKKLGGTHRYSNSSLCCSPRVQYPPPPPPNIPSPIDLVHIPADKEPLLSGDEAREGKGFGDDGVVVGCAVALVVCVGMLAACIAYRRLKDPAAMASELDHTESETLEPDEEGARSDDKTVLSSAKLCEEIASVVASVTQMTSENQTTRIRKVQDFLMLAKSVTLDGVPGRNSCPNHSTTKAFGASFEDNTGTSRDVSGTSSSASSVITELQAGRVVNRYEYVRHLGSGTHGEVILVCDIDTEIQYTMKIPKDTNVQAVVQEAYLLAMLNHPNIIKHKETFVHNGQLIVVTEYCSMGDLQHYFDNLKVPFSEEFVRGILFQLASAVAHMHMHTLAHRDIKPSNIFVSEKGFVKLGDLGSGRVIVDTSDTFAGTPMFMAPQIIAGEPYTKECDVYSLGSVIYYLCSGKVAYSEAKSMDEIKELQLQGPDISLIRNSYSGMLVNAIARMMSPAEVLRPSANDIAKWEWLQQDLHANKATDVHGDIKLLVHSTEKNW